MDTCTWAPTVFSGMGTEPGAKRFPAGAELTDGVRARAEGIEALGLSHLLIAQRWWGSADEIEGSSLDCLAMTAYFAAITTRLNLVTAIHPGFFEPTAIAKWGSTMDRLTGGRWSINVTSGWNLREFDMYGIDALTHDARYARSREFIEVLRGAWAGRPFSYRGTYYQTDELVLEPPPISELVVYQGGQSPAALDMAANLSDWMFLNGGTVEKISGIVTSVRDAATAAGRNVRFALYAAPLCRATDADAWAEIDARLARIDPALIEQRKQTVSGAEGMWRGDDPLSHLDTNEGFAARLIGSPDTVFERIKAFRDAGVGMMHLDLSDTLFREEVLPAVQAL